MRTVGSILIAALATIALVSCGSDVAAPTGYAPGQTVEAYAYTHGGYVGQAVVTTDDAGSIDVTLDEAFLPHSLAIVDIESDQWNEDNTASYVQRGDTVYVARYIAYDGTNYTGTTVGTSLVYVASDEQGNAAGNTELEKAILRNESTMANWYDVIEAGGFQIFTEFGGEPIPVTTTEYGSVTKRGSEYWNFGIGWTGNIEAIEEAAQQFGVSYSLDELERGSDNFWSVADATTGATASDFPDYFALIQQAVARLAVQ